MKVTDPNPTYNPSSGMMSTLTSKSSGGFMARQLLPAALLVPIVLGWLRWKGQLYGLYDTVFGLALFTSANVVVFAFLTWKCAARLDYLDRARWLAESKRKESESRFKTVIEGLPQMVWTCLPDGRCDYLSRQWIEYTGQSEKDQLGSQWTHQIHPNDWESVARLWRVATESGTSFDTEYRIRDRDGNYRWFRAMAVPLRDASGTISKWFGTSTDINSVKSMEAALRDSEASFRQLADAMPQIVWTATPPDLSPDYFNRRWYEYTRQTPGQNAGSEWKPILHPDDRQSCRERWTRSISTGEPYEIQYRFKRASDDTYRWHLGRAMPIRDAHGKIVRWFGTCTDIEECKQAEAAIISLNEDLENRVECRTAELASVVEQLDEARSQLQCVLDAATCVSIISTDTNGVIRLFNSGAERMLQYKSGEVVGRATPELFHDRMETALRGAELSRQFGRPIEGLDTLLAVARQTGSEERSWTYVRKDGSRLAVNLAVTPVIRPDGINRGFLGIAVDITDRERQLRQSNEDLAKQTRRAEEANRAKSEFLAGMSHEIRTPLNAVLGMADLLWETDLNTRQRQYVEVFRRAGSNVLTLINDILDLSKIEAGQFSLEHIEFDLEDVVDEVIELIGPKAYGKGLLLLTSWAPGTRTSFVGDPTRIRQVLTNLLGNAVKFTESGEIVLSVGGSASDPNGGTLEFAVSDTGIGIPEAKLQSVFEDFSQADSSTTRRYGGTGLGLSISRRMVEKMAGRLTVTSLAGAGSTFRFSIPLETGRAELVPGSRSLAARPPRGKRILLVDRNTRSRSVLLESFEEWGLEAEGFNTAEGALTALASRPFDLVLVDHSPPGADAFGIAEELRRADGNIPILILAADPHSGSPARRQDLRVTGYAAKPVKRRELSRSICAAMKTVAGSDLPVAPAVYAAPGTALLHPRRILIAEDSADNRLLVDAYLNGSSCSLQWVEDGAAAVEAFSRDGQFDLILMDLQMPVMDGLTATRAIRGLEKQRGLSPIPIVALTANASASDKWDCQDAGCDSHLSKPVSRQRLLEVINEYAREVILAGSSPRETVRVVIPPGLDGIVPAFLAKRRSEIPEMVSLLASSEYDRLRILGHNMKGCGAPYGFPELSKSGAHIEEAAKRSDHDALSSQISKLSEYLASIDLVSA